MIAEIARVGAVLSLIQVSSMRILFQRQAINIIRELAMVLASREMNSGFLRQKKKVQQP